MYFVSLHERILPATIGFALLDGFQQGPPASGPFAVRTISKNYSYGSKVLGSSSFTPLPSLICPFRVKNGDGNECIARGKILEPLP